jgi:hypothetical protein
MHNSFFIISFAICTCSTSLSLLLAQSESCCGLSVVYVLCIYKRSTNTCMKRAYIYECQLMRKYLVKSTCNATKHTQKAAMAAAQDKLILIRRQLERQTTAKHYQKYAFMYVGGHI